MNKREKLIRVTAPWRAFLRLLDLAKNCSIGVALVCALFFAIGCSTRVAVAEVRRVDVWFAPIHPNDRPAGKGVPDYFDLFSDSAPWQSVASKISVFQIYLDLLRRGSDDEIRSLISYLRSKGISLSIEMPVLADTAWCEPGTKRKRWMVPLIARLKRLGGDLNYIAMVGPLVDGHVYKKKFYCNRPVEDVAADAAATITEIRKFYPNVIVGDIEPLAKHPEYPNWGELPVWLEAFKRQAGVPISFIHLDVRWALNWKEPLLDLVRDARRFGVRVGVIYHGDPLASSSEAVAAGLAKHEAEVEIELGVRPDEVIFQSWLNYPEYALPEDNPSSMTGIVRSYLLHR
ncbi:hypothetical protein ACQR1I_20325 [Bradyrhizobium sp. HKCCYLS2038]|uniref:hypothetical protein n=1 Tax=unclassified Bradyrhizobium TaxID=2631580 RepID=UPI003EBE605E